MHRLEIAGVGKAGTYPKIGLFHRRDNTTKHVGLLLVGDGDTKDMCDLTELAGVRQLKDVLHQDNPVRFLKGIFSANSQGRLKDNAHYELNYYLDPPIDSESRQEVWGAGVTYESSNAGRNEELAVKQVQQQGPTLYDKVRVARRPELFPKAPAWRVVGTEDPLLLPREEDLDINEEVWVIPEPEVAFWIGPDGKVKALTIANDATHRGREGDNALNLPQAKIEDGLCALGDLLQLGPYSDDEVRELDIEMKVMRKSSEVFGGTTSLGKMEKHRRIFTRQDSDNPTLPEWLLKKRRFPDGVVLMTGTGIVPPADPANRFTLQENDVVNISIPKAGLALENPVEIIQG